MQKTCAQCRQGFDIRNDDLAFYERVSPVFNGKRERIPPPTLCPTCRMQRRLAFRNERSLHHRKCSKTGRNIISMYRASVPFPIYENDAWWGDDWDPLEYGQEVAFDRSFLEQYSELLARTPRMARVQQGENENSRYTNCASDNKNCYLIFTAANNEDCLYSLNMDNCRNCVDNTHINRSELCYECVDTEDCYRCAFLQNCVNCSDSFFLKNCIGCKNCFGCINLRNAEYHIFNEEHSKEEYEQRMREMNLGSFAQLKDIKSRIAAFFLQHPHRFYEGVQNENVSGDHVSQCKNAHHCFDVNHLEDCAYCDGMRNARDCRDASYYGVSSINELLYECEGVGHGVSNVLFSKLIWGGSSNVLYSYECFASHHLFGCIGLRHKQYCIFNTQYTKEEYEALVPKIIDHMKKHEEWGEFFPMSLSPFGYNETAAMGVIQLTAEDAAERGWKWLSEDTSEDDYSGLPVAIPDDIADVSDDITQQILLCEETGHPYKIIPQELKFYREMHLPIPRKSPDQRHRERMSLRNPRMLWQRNCAKCGKDIQTSYAPDRPEIVYCEECYLASVY